MGVLTVRDIDFFFLIPNICMNGMNAREIYTNEYIMGRNFLGVKHGFFMRHSGTIAWCRGEIQASFTISFIESFINRLET